MNYETLKKISTELSDKPRGILAADESTGTIKKRFDLINLESNFENRRKYRELLFSTPDLGNFISGVILFDETIKQKDKNGKSFCHLLKDSNIHVGIKVDAGAKNLAGSNEEKITEGLDNLNDRMQEYAQLGATFAKWRAVIEITKTNPSNYCIELNSHALARYAKICQHNNVVPIVEPEVLMDGDHDIQKCYEVTSATLDNLFKNLKFQNVYLEGILLKPNMVIAGLKCAKQATINEVAEKTIDCLKNNIPEEVPGIVFLSGGQSDQKATEHLNEMNKIQGLSWKLSFSYGRALQQSVLYKWKGDDNNIYEAQKELLKRSKLNSMATKGEYLLEME